MTRLPEWYLLLSKEQSHLMRKGIFSPVLIKKCHGSCLYIIWEGFLNYLEKDRKWRGETTDGLKIQRANWNWAETHLQWFMVFFGIVLPPCFTSREQSLLFGNEGQLLLLLGWDCCSWWERTCGLVTARPAYQEMWSAKRKCNQHILPYWIWP